MTNDMLFRANFSLKNHKKSSRNNTNVQNISSTQLETKTKTNTLYVRNGCITGTLIGSPLSTVLRNLLMEHLKVREIGSSCQKLTIWLRNADDEIAIWKHDKSALNKLLNCLNSRLPNLPYINRFLNAKSHFHLFQLQTVVKTVVTLPLKLAVLFSQDKICRFLNQYLCKL